MTRDEQDDDTEDEFVVSDELAQRILDADRNGEWSEPMTMEEFSRKWGLDQPPEQS